MEKTVIQSYGFRNVVENGKTIGFQFKVRNSYYRGVYLSQILAGYCTVDGEDIGRDKIEWIVNGRQYTWEEMKKARQVHWDPLDCATIVVKKPGGLKQGFHDLRYSFTSTKSYMPPSLNTNNAKAVLSPDPSNGTTKQTTGMGVNHHYRRLIIV